jgi:uncharacterized heparinase superfamily protein
MPARRVPSMLAPMTFGFLNETQRIPKASWNATVPSELWRYNLHYFDDLNAIGAVNRRQWHQEAIADWIQSNPPAKGAGWDPYPTSLRVVNWIKWALEGAEPGEPVIYSLATQIRALRQRLEYHLLGNHLFANAKALVFAGLFFEGGEAYGWLDKGMTILAREIPEQILPDGGQFERSTMYHALALEDVLDLVNLAAAFPTAIPGQWSDFARSWPVLARRMRAWLSTMRHPDGEISFFNDAAIGIAPSPAELDHYADGLVGSSQGHPAAANGLRLIHLSQTGYIRADASDAVLLIDVAPIGPDYLPGHAHADTLSFELSLFGHRVIVNGGTSRYGTGPERDAERGTPAHSTVTVDGQDSSEVWAGFRVARRAKPFDLAVEETAEEIRVSCAHDGYTRLPGRSVHRRNWRLRARELRVEDRVEGRYQSAVARFHLLPFVEVTVDQSGCAGLLRLAGGKEVRWRSGSAVRADPSNYAPEFGRRLPTQCLTLTIQGSATAWLELSW